MILPSLGERFGLRIIPGATSFLVLPKGVSRSRAIGSVIQSLSTVAGPASSLSGGTLAAVDSAAPPTSPPPHASSEEPSILGEVTTNAVIPSSDIPTKAFDFILVISGDETIIRRFNNLEDDGTEVFTCSTNGKGSEAKWRLDPKDVLETLNQLPSQ